MGGPRTWADRILPTQFSALFVKNWLVAWRNRRATLLRLLAPFLFLLLALLIDRALQANDAANEAFKDVKRSESEAVANIPRCTDDVYIGEGKACIELAYSPDNAITRMIMGNVTSRNTPSDIQAMGFASRDAVQAFLLDHSDYIIAAVHFVFDDLAPNNLQGFIIQTNTTTKSFKGTSQDPNKFVQLPLQSAVHREIARYQLSLSPSTKSLADKLSWYIGLKTFPHPTIATTSVLSQVLGPFIFAACMFSFVTQISTVVMEKEQYLRQALRTMGMTDLAYWASWGAWEVVLAFISAHLITIFGLILQFNLFLNNSYGLLWFLFFLFQLAMSSFALLCAAFIQKTQTAVYLGFAIFIVGWIMQTVVIFGVPYSPDFWKYTGVVFAFDIFPWDLLVKGFQDLGAATVNSDYPGLRWSERSRYCQNIDNIDAQNAWAVANNYDPRTQYVSFKCVMPLNNIYKVFIALWIVYFVLAVYFDNVIKNEHGVRKPFYYFLMPSYWFPRAAQSRRALEHVLKEDKHGPTDEAAGGGDEDVLAEESKMRALLNHRTGTAGELAGEVDVRNAIEVYGLKKLFGGSRGCFGMSCKCCSACDCCSCEVVDPFWPIKGSWFSIPENHLFCLLGPNGAGKTTTINCLTGVLPPTYGDALVYGQSIRSQGGINNIRSIMGVCPQFDILWPELSGLEHLLLYGRIKGCYGWSGVLKEAEALLEKVKLTSASTQRTGAYSGGMKRRLSVAIALLGDPKVVYLDEPTTGMDPISRRYVWDIIQEAKVGRAIILTTHSMEEADILGDRIAIMARGRLRCIGSSIRLKQRFGAGYQVAVSVVPPRASPEEVAALGARAEGVKRYFKERLGLEPVEEGRVYINFLVSRERESALIAFLPQLEADQTALGITDIQLSLTSLEEVFLTIARKAEEEIARATGQTERYTLPDGATLEIPIGTDLVVNPQSGQHYAVRWGTDEAGRLVILDVLPAAPAAGQVVPAAPGAYIPPMAQPQAAYYGGGVPVAAPVQAPVPPVAGGYYPPVPVAGQPALYQPALYADPSTGRPVAESGSQLPGYVNISPREQL